MGHCANECPDDKEDGTIIDKRGPKNANDVDVDVCGVRSRPPQQQTVLSKGVCWQNS